MPSAGSTEPELPSTTAPTENRDRKAVERVAVKRDRSLVGTDILKCDRIMEL